MRRRSTILLAVTAIIAVAAVTAGVVAWLRRGPSTTRIPIEAVAVVAQTDERTLSVRLTYSSCTEFDHVDVDEGARSVRLTAHVHPLQSCGTAPIDRREVTVRLGAPLWDRGLVDGATGAALHTG